MAESKPAAGLQAFTVPGQDQKVYLHAEADLTNRDIAAARLAPGPALELSFTPEGQQKAARLSERHLGRPVAVLIDGKVVSVHVLRAKLTDRAVITGSFGPGEVERIVAGVRGK